MWKILFEKAKDGANAPVPENGGRHNASRKKRRFVKITAAAAAVTVCVAGVWTFSYYRPFLQASAQTIYDTGGHLNGIKASELNHPFVDSYNGFGLELLRQTYKGESGKNVFQSPASVYLALGMTYNGAKGQTAAEFAKVLGSSESLNGFNQECAGLQGILTGRFRLANSIWLNSLFTGKIGSDFLARDKTYFGASVSTLNLSSHSSADLINQWVKKNTNDRIDPKFQKFDSNTAMLLINTITFKSDWEQKFLSYDTRSSAFHSPSGVQTVKFMNAMRPHYISDDTVQAILLPYNDGKTSMLVLLPKKDINDMLGKLTPSSLANYVAQSRNSKENAELSLPRVHFNCDEILNGPLGMMGLKLAFDRDHADFRGMEAANASLPLYISKVRHMTFLAIDENGTEAAAATSVEMTCGAMPLKNIMNVDHPFLAAIVNNETGVVLFSGVVNYPSA